jgi:predicted aldo/keto reductase-like oxidoreductase
LHVAALELLPRAPEIIAPVAARLEAAYREAVSDGPDDDFPQRWREGLPDWDQIPGLPNVRLIVGLHNLARAFDLVDFARERYANLDGRNHWVPGYSAARFDEARLRGALVSSPYGDRIVALLRDAHALLYAPGTKTLP